MFPSLSSDDFQKKSSPSTSVMPFAPPPPPPPPPPALFSHFEEPVTGSRVPVNFANEIIGSSSSSRRPNNIVTDNVKGNPHSPVPWSTGLCDCCADVNSCCLTCWCPCVTFGRIAEMVDRGSTSCGVSGALYMLILCLTGCSCLYSCFYRSKLRGQYFLEESPCTDCCLHCCCEECALCQEYRELKSRGFDMSIGWHGNMERQKRLATVAPATEGGMTR